MPLEVVSRTGRAASTAVIGISPSPSTPTLKNPAAPANLAGELPVCFVAGRLVLVVNGHTKPIEEAMSNSIAD